MSMDIFSCFALLFLFLFSYFLNLKKNYRNLNQRGKVLIRPNEKQKKQKPLQCRPFQKVKILKCLKATVLRKGKTP